MNDSSIWNDPRITAYVLGELDDRDRDAFEAEMKANRPLAAAVDEAQGVADRLATFYEAEPTPSFDAGRRAAILSAHPADAVSRTSEALSPAVGEAGGVAWRSGRWRVAAIAVAIAATLLVVVGVSPWGSSVRSVSWHFAGDEAISTGETGEAVSPQSEPGSGLGATGGPAVERPATSSFSRASDEAKSLGPDPSDASGPRGLSQLSTLGVPKDVRDAEWGERAERLQRDRSFPMAEAPRDESFGRRGGALDAPDEARRADPSKPRERRRRGTAEGDTYGAPSMSVGGLYGEKIVQDSRAKEGDAAEAYPGTGPSRRPMSDRDSLSFAENGPSGEAGGEAGQEASDLGDGVGPEFAESVRSAGNTAVGLAQERPGKSASILPSQGHGIGGIGGGLGESDRGQSQSDQGQGPGMAGDRFDPIIDNPFRRVSEHPLGTFSADVDTASYAKVRDFLLRTGRLPRPDAVRIEELVNYFDYGYEAPAADAEHPFRAGVDLAVCPWNSDHRLARVSIQGKRLDGADRPRANLVFLVDTSGSMNAPNRLPLVRDGLKSLVDQMDAGDRIAIVTYAGSAGMVLGSTPGSERAAIRRALTELSAGGSTNGGAGITLAYQTARDHFIADGVNRVVLCSDGDFNVGTTGTDELVRTVEKEAKGGVFLSVLGFGMGNHNDAMLEQISGRGNGNYFFIDNASEARKVLVEQTAGTLVTIAKDVKLQVEFNPRRVSAYRLIGYENRVLAAEDFNDDRKDAGEIGAGHSVTALLELVPAGTTADASPPPVDQLRYQTRPGLTEAAERDEWLTLKFRYKRPDEETSRLIEAPASGVAASGAEGEFAFDQADPGFRFAAAVAGFGMQLRRSPYAGGWTLPDVRRAATAASAALGDDPLGRRGEFLQMVERAIELTVAEPGAPRPRSTTSEPR